MHPRYIAFFTFIFVVGTILGLVIEDGTVGATEKSTLNNLLTWQQVSTEESWGFFDVIGSIPGYMGSLWTAATWNFAFLDGSMVYLKWIIWAPLMAMFVWGMILTFLSIFQRVLS